jgi:hypothetical protein
MRKKRCPTCKKLKSAADFSYDGNRKDKLSWACRICNGIRTRKWQSAHPVQMRRNRQQIARWCRRHPGHALLRKFGISLEQYFALLQKQGGGCAICGRKVNVTKKRRMPVDHCHKTNVVRGILCDHCNTALGLFQDSPDLLRRALAYLGSVRAE